MRLKFWKKKLEKESDDNTEDYDLLNTKDIVMTTTESEIELKSCKVRSDHFVTYKDNKVEGAKNRKPRIIHSPKIFILPVWEILGVSGENQYLKVLKKVLVRWALPKYLRFRTYTVRREGEVSHNPDTGTKEENGNVTHDPHEDNYDKEQKMLFEAMLKLEGKFAEANAGAEIYEGMKGKPKWFDYIPYIVIAVIVGLFLFSFQIQPNM